MSDPNNDSKDAPKTPAAQCNGEEASTQQSMLIPMEEGEEGAYIILVHGITDPEWNSQERWKQWQTWMAKIGFDSSHKIWRYQYDLSGDDSQLFTPNGIEVEALKLLECLKSYQDGESEERKKKKRFVFVMLDVAGIIVKKALTIASRNPAKYGNLDSLTSILIFVNTPHRAARIEHVEDYIGELLTFGTSFPSKAVEKIQNMSRAIQDTNSAFFDTKILSTALIYNIVSDSLQSSIEPENTSNNDDDDDDDEDEDEDDKKEDDKKENENKGSAEETTNTEQKSPDASPEVESSAPVAKLSRPLCYYGTSGEVTYKSSLSHDKLVRDSHGLADKFVDELKPETVNFLKHAYDNNHLRLLHSQTPPVYPLHPVQSEQLPIKWTDNIVNSETYKKWIEQRRLTVLHLHGTSNVSTISQALAKRFSQAAGRGLEIPVETETLYFEFNSQDPRFNNVRAMLSFFLVSVFHFQFRMDDNKMASELERIYHFRGWTLNDMIDGLAIRSWNYGSRITMLIGRFEECDSESRSWFLNKLPRLSVSRHARCPFIITSQNSKDIKADIPQWNSIDLDSLGDIPSADVADPLFTQTAPQDGSVSSSTPERDVLYCIQYALRPMSAEELAFMVSLKDQSNWTDGKHKGLVESILDAANPVVYTHNNEVFAQHVPPLPTDPTETSKAHATLAKRCLQYLRDPAVQAEIKEFCDCYQSVDELPISLQRHNLIGYAVNFWASHYRLAGDYQPFEDAIDFFSVSTNRDAWSNAYYTLGHLLVRLQQTYTSPLPLVSMLGLDDLVAEFIRQESDSPSRDTDGGLALVEASRNGHISTAKLLIEEMSKDGRKLDDSALQDAISGAGSFGAGGALQYLVEYASKISGFEWPVNIVSRVAALGLHEIVKLLLDSGLGTNPPDPFQGRSPLHMASMNVHLETVKVLLDAGADLKCLAQYGRTPLHAAVTSADPIIVRTLIEAGAEVNTPDGDDLTPLQFGMTWGRTEAMEELLKSGADPNHGKEGENDPAWSEKPLLYCSRFGYTEATRMLLDYDADINCRSGTGSPLYLALKNGRVEISRMLLEKGADPNDNPEGCDLPLILALRLGDDSIAMINLLLDKGARIDESANSSEYPRTALATAVKLKRLDLVKYLLKKGADVNHIGKNSSCALYVAAWSGYYDHVRVLLDAGADVNIVEWNNWRPINAAYDLPKILKLLLEEGADANVVSNEGSCLHLASLYNKPDSVKMLLKYRSKLNLEVPYPSSREPDSDEGYTALCLACEQGYTRIVRMLAEAGANRTHRTRLGKVPLDICVYFGNLDAAVVLLEYHDSIDHVDSNGNMVLHHITDKTPQALVRMLVNAGADFHALNKNGEAPLETAVSYGNAAVVKYLLSKKADLTKCSDEGYSLVHAACKQNSLKTLQVLVKKGKADVQRADSMEGAPSLLMVIIERWLKADLDLLRYLVEKCHVDMTRKSGYLDYPIIAAAAYRQAPQAQYLLEHGADPNMEDSSGRRPLHLAGVHAIMDVVDVLLDSKVQTLVDNKPPRDVLGRSPVHFAAVGGNWNVFQKVSGLYDDSELISPDNEGWTPLFWALLQETVEVEVIQHLINHGADIWARVKSRKTEWSPLKLARYIGSSDAVCALLKPDPPTRVNSSGKEEQWDEEFHLTRKASRGESRICDSCRVGIRGVNYACRICSGYDLCFRCYMSRDLFHLFHPNQDDWDERGPEYMDDDENEASNDEVPKSSDDVTSQTEADSDAESDHDETVNDLEDLPDSDSQGESEGEEDDDGDDE